MSILSGLFGSTPVKVPAIHDSGTLTKFFNVNNAPVATFCNTIPVLQPSIISTAFGASIVTLFILVIYLLMYLRSGDATGVEKRLLTALILGNIAYSFLAFEDWFELHYQIVFCNDYKNGVINLYQVSELIETYKLKNILSVYITFTKNLITTYWVLVMKQFTSAIAQTSLYIYGVIVDGSHELSEIVSKWLNK